MAMPKNITLINKKTGIEKKLTFSHALRLLLLDKSQSSEGSYDIKGKYIFNGNDIIRKPSNQESTES
jgi:hypothetical protein